MKKMNILFCVIAATLALQVQVVANDKVDIDAMNQLFGTTYAGDIYSGYLSADTTGTVQFHYMFYPSEDQPLTKPVILWLNGGPGCSSLQGAFNENGPFVFKAGTATFESNQYSWTKIANMLYIESPIGVGFSYGPAGQQSDESTAQYNINALVDFFSKFQEYKNAQFFITGESYAGIYIPTLTSQIIDYNANPTNPNVPSINLQGIAIGNGCTDPTECTEDADPFPIHQMKFYGRQGFISESLYEKILAVQQDCYGQTTAQCKELADQVDVEVYGTDDDNILFNPYNIYGYCYTYTPEGGKRSKKTLGLRLSDDSDIPPCADVQGLYHYLKNTQVRQLFHINDKSADWVVCSKQFGDYKINPLGSYYLYPKIIKSGIRILKFSGDVDAIVPLTGTLYWVDKLQKELYLTTLHPWRPWFVDGQRDVDPDQNAGYVVDLDGLTLLTIRNAGHMVPLEKRLESLVFLTNFINNDVFP